MEQKLSAQNLETTAKYSRSPSQFDAQRMENLQDWVKKFAAQLTLRFAQEIALDAHCFKKQVLKLVRRGLPPRPGRPNDPHLDAACRMIHDGKTVKQVLRVQIRDFDRLDTYGRYLAEKGLRAAIARRRKRPTSRGTPRIPDEFSAVGNPPNMRG